MHKTTSPNIYNLLISAVCAVGLAAVLIEVGSNEVIAMLSTFITVLCVQVAFLRREVSVLKDQMTMDKRT